MRTYKFLNKTFGLKSLCEKRLRRTRINELNDPFELRPFDLTSPTDRWAFQTTRSQVARSFGLLCFSSHWCDPVIWAHYSDKHRGLCLGFEVPDEIGESSTKKVEYIRTPLPFPANFLRLQVEQQLPTVKKMIFTKYENWKYEEEIRTWTDLEEEYFDFCDQLQLKEVIIGAECNLSKSEVARALDSPIGQVTVRKARPSHDSFQMVEDEKFD